ncbi:hypothetical protein [Chryseobacterium oryctis]|uniref:Uncharacterized protein n=1 Tax=Chryseobacterium oryctis TaxID=2952618 RepID=A0ABT3HR65_9FLAO|nr:hypothetical protein [Chryseobacterium oryctis]MCW3162252.1 hypothetical protein [Chryseobacterium oryctis]
MKKYFFVLLSFLLLFSCEKKEKVSAKENTHDSVVSFKIPDSLSKNNLFTSKNEKGVLRIWVQSKEPRGKYFYSDTLNILKAEQYAFENNKFSKLKTVNLAQTEWSYFEIDSSNIKTEKLNGKEYFLISANTTNMGKAVPDQIVQFWAINTANVDDNYELLYSGYPSNLCTECIKGDFVENKKLNSNQSVKKILYDFAKKSKMIYQPNVAEKNISHYKNYDEKWQIDNKTDSHFGAGNIGEMSVIYSTYYKENLFELSGGVPDEIENENYLVVSYFRGDIIAYDKIKKLYFPVIVESCAHFCNKSIEFINEHTLKITYEDESSYELDLHKILFKK